MKILFTAGSLDRGGKERRLVSLMEDLAERGIEIGLIASEQSPHMPQVRPLCRSIYDYKAGKPTFNLRQHSRAMAEFQPDLMHSWNGICTTYSILAGWRRRCPVVTSEITNARAMGSFSKEFWLTRVNFAFARSILSNSQAGLKAKLAPEGKGRVIYNGFRLGRLSTIDRKSYRDLAKPDGLNIVMAARFSSEKDHETLLDVASLAQEQGRKIHFVLAGEGPRLAEMQAEAERRDLKNVTFPGHVSDMDNLLAHMDVGVLATDPRNHEEGIPNSVMEYMAHAMPAVVTAGPAIPEIVTDGHDGFIVAPRNPGELLAKLNLLETSPELLRQLGTQAAATVRERFDVREMAGRFIELYQELLNTRVPANLVAQES